MTSHGWKTIEDLPDNWKALASSELPSLASIWRDQSKNLEKTDALREFNQRLAREWSIETGIIENLYSIDRGVTQILIEKGIEASLIPHGSTDKPAEEVVAILRDHQEVLEGMFDFVVQRRELSTSYIKQLHQEMTRNQASVSAVDGAGRAVEAPLLRGQWKTLPNNPTRPDSQVHEYCPPEHVQSEMDRLVEMHQAHVARAIPTEVEAAWLHHRFTQIHPFQDGNGRIARALASLIFLRASWFPLVVDRDARARYIESLEKADLGDLGPLIDLFARLAKKAFVKSLSISEKVLHDHEPVHQLIAAAAMRLKARFENQREKQNRVFEHGRELEKLAQRKLSETARELDKELKVFSDKYFATIENSGDTTRHWFYKQIIESAKSLGYFADTRTHHTWIRLKIKEERQGEIVVSFHSLGVDFLGILAASAFMEYRDRSDEGDVEIDGPYILCADVFQCAFNEGLDTVVRRFEDWLNEIVLVGLDKWRKQL